MELDRGGMYMVPILATKDELNAVDVEELWKDGLEQGKNFWDDVSGKKLDPSLTQEARREEVREAERMGVWRKVPREECVKATGHGTIGTRWVDTDNGDDLHPQVRSRLVAQELKRGGLQR